MKRSSYEEALGALNQSREDSAKFGDLGDAFSEFDLLVELDDNDDVCGLEFTGGKVSSERLVFLNAIEPYVEKGSWIDWMDEEFSIWRELFTGEGVEVLDCVIVPKRDLELWVGIQLISKTLQNSSLFKQQQEAVEVVRSCLD